MKHDLQPCGHPMDYGVLDHPECFPPEYIDQKWAEFAECLDALSIAAQNVSIGLSGSVRVIRRTGEALAALKVSSAP
jgi:hypothetical protein